MEYEYVLVKNAGLLSRMEKIFNVLWGALMGTFAYTVFIYIEVVIVSLRPEITLLPLDYWTTSLIFLLVGAVINSWRTKRKAKKIAENPPKYKTYGSIETRHKWLSSNGFRSMMVTVDLLAEAFNKTKQIFSGSVEDIVEKGVSKGMDKGTLEIGFGLLEQNGYLAIDGDKFQPTSSLLDLMMLKPTT